MPADAHAVLQDDDGRPALVFERVLAYPRERVWRALVDPEELAHWHPTPFELIGSSPTPPAPGALVHYRTTTDGPEIPSGRLLEYDPPRLLVYTWADDRLRWELIERHDGCLLRLTHTFDDRFKAARDATGWHLCLDALSSSLDQLPRPQRGVGPRLPEGWSGSTATTSSASASRPSRQRRRRVRRRFRRRWRSSAGVRPRRSR